MLAEIASGHIELADLFFLLAAVFAGVAMIATAVRGSVEGALVPAAVCFGFLGLFVL